MTTELRSRDPGPELPGLSTALDHAADQHFDLGAVRAGIDGLVLHRRRRRRRITSAAAAAAAVVVAGGTTLLLGPGRDLGQVAVPPPVPTVAASPTGASPTGASPTSTAAEPSSARLTDRPPSQGVVRAPVPEVAYAVPDAAMLTAEQVGRGREPGFDSGDYANQPVATGQVCDPATGASGPAPVAGRQRSWNVSPTSFDGQVEVVVTGWATGTGPQAFADTVADSGRCVWLDPVTEVAAPGWEGDEGHLVATSPPVGAATAIAVQRVGDLLVGVTAYDSAGDAAAQAEAVRVSDLVVDALVASGLPATGR